VLLASNQVGVFEIRKLIDAVANGFKRLYMLSCSLLSYAHQHLAHFRLVLSWVVASSICVHFQQLIGTFGVSTLVLQLRSVKVIHQRLYTTNLFKLLNRLIVLPLVYQAKRSEYGCLLVIPDYLLQDLS
jgi:hypothetical protein